MRIVSAGPRASTTLQHRLPPCTLQGVLIFQHCSSPPSPSPPTPTGTHHGGCGDARASECDGQSVGSGSRLQGGAHAEVLAARRRHRTVQGRACMRRAVPKGDGGCLGVRAEEGVMASLGSPCSVLGAHMSSSSRVSAFKPCQRSCRFPTAPQAPHLLPGSREGRKPGPPGCCTPQWPTCRLPPLAGDAGCRHRR